jgi:hypothetical protein
MTPFDARKHRTQANIPPAGFDVNNGAVPGALVFDAASSLGGTVAAVSSFMTAVALVVLVIFKAAVALVVILKAVVGALVGGFGALVGLEDEGMGVGAGVGAGVGETEGLEVVGDRRGARVG